MSSRKSSSASSPLIHKGLVVPAALAAAAWLGVAHYLDSTLLAARSAEQVAAAAQQQAEQYAAQIRQQLAARGRQQREIARDITETAAATAELPAQVSVRHFPRDQIAVGAGNPPLNFAQVDLLKRSEPGDQQPPEFLHGEDDQWHLHNAVPLEQAVVLFSEPFAAFESALKPLDSGAGAVALVQKFPDGPPRSLWRTGQGNGQAASAEVGGSHLSVQFTPSASFAQQHGLSSRWLYAAAGGGLLITLLLLLRLMPRDTPAPWERLGKGTRSDARERMLEPLQTDMPAAKHEEPPPQRAAAALRADSETPAQEPAPGAPGRALDMSANFPRQVFRAYDIRGIAGSEINEPFAYQLGRALGTVALHAGEKILLVGRDGRNSSELLSDCLIEGIRDSGCHTVNLGLVPSPLLYYACARGKNTSSGVMVTASHNPAAYNGFKIVLRGRPLAEDKLLKLHAIMHKGPFASGEGSSRQQDLRESYIEQIYGEVALAGQPHIVVDAGNGATSLLAPRLFEQLGCAVTPLFCEIDGDFPNHPPDPSRPENLQALIEKVRETNADLGVALDGDGDRVTLISASGRIAWADQLVMLLARDILARHPGADVIFDVKSSRALGQLVNQYGGRPLMWKTGHAPMKNKMIETGALLGGELSGHIFIKDRWFGFDDGIYAAARILEIMALREQSLDQLLDSLPQLVSTPEILLPVEEGDKFALIEQLKKEGQFNAADINTLDGLRIEYADGWGLVRASNTGAALTLRFEAESEEALARIRKQIMDQLKKIAPKLVVPDWQLV